MAEPIGRIALTRRAVTSTEGPTTAHAPVPDSIDALEKDFFAAAPGMMLPMR
ncbi:MAG: hypothetical protein ACO3JL_14810 [Myxococcota bacterium]